LCDDMRAHHVLNPGARVGCDRLMLVRFPYIDLDGHSHGDGEIIVLDTVAQQVSQIFTILHAQKFPIAKAHLMNTYDGDDDASMADNNTSAFNDRDKTGGGTKSLHAYGVAIDVNPVQNPYIKHSSKADIFSPPSGSAYADRLAGRQQKAEASGMAEAIVDVFADHGFTIWGGDWHNPTDYQHFQVSSHLAQQLIALSPEDARAQFGRYVERYLNCRKDASLADAADRKKCAKKAEL
jgi:hypothetical protein